MSLDHDRTIATQTTSPDPHAPAPWTPDRPLTLRAHNLLCLQGWEGHGYSPAFTANMDAVHAHLRAHPDTDVELVGGPDTLCGACPLLEVDACHHDRHDNGWISAHDVATASRAGLSIGQHYAWRTLEAAIADAFTGADLASHCARCRWQPLGLCAAGIDRLRARLIA